MKRNTKDIIHITDCHDTNPEGGSLAAVKVRLAYAAHAEKNHLATGLIETVPAEEFNTIDVGAKFSEVVTSAVKPERLIVAVNAAPPSIAGGNGNNERTNFVLGRLRNGVVFGGTWGGHCLSYLKHEIEELHELLDSNNGSQFRSLEVLPQALVEYATGKIAPGRLQPVEKTHYRIPSPPEFSHAWTVDNFGNVKLHLHHWDHNALHEKFAAAAKHNDVRDDKALIFPIRFAFGDRSVEFGLPEALPDEHVYSQATLGRTLFGAEIGETRLTLTSSSRQWHGHQLGFAPQLATLRKEPGKKPAFSVPKIGAPLWLRHG